VALPLRDHAERAGVRGGGKPLFATVPLHHRREGAEGLGRPGSVTTWSCRTQQLAYGKLQDNILLHRNNSVNKHIFTAHTHPSFASTDNIIIVITIT
jgi:hypothetical protein